MFKALLGAAVIILMPTTFSSMAQAQSYPPPAQPQPQPNPYPQPAQPQPSPYPQPTQPQPNPYPQPSPYPQPAQQSPYPGQNPYQGQQQFIGPFHHHRGLMVGFGLGLGSTTFEGCENDCIGEGRSFAWDFNVGGFLSPRLALMLDVNGYFKRESFEDFDSESALGVIGIAAQYWLIPNLWLKGGIGLAFLDVLESDGFIERQDVSRGFAGTFAVGYEVFASRNLAIDLSARLNTITITTFNDLALEEDVNIAGLSALVGFRWK